MWEAKTRYDEDQDVVSIEADRAYVIQPAPGLPACEPRDARAGEQLRAASELRSAAAALITRAEELERAANDPFIQSIILLLL